MTYGYVRANSTETDKENQLKCLKEKGEFQIFIDDKDCDDEFQRLLTIAKRGDTLIAESINKIAGNMVELQDMAEDLSFMGITLITIRESIDTSTPEGKLKVLMSDHFTHF